jgi:hypothetical protein
MTCAPSITLAPISSDALLVVDIPFSVSDSLNRVLCAMLLVVVDLIFTLSSAPGTVDRSITGAVSTSFAV